METEYYTNENKFSWITRIPLRASIRVMQQKILHVDNTSFYGIHFVLQSVTQNVRLWKEKWRKSNTLLLHLHKYNEIRRKNMSYAHEASLYKTCIVHGNSIY